MRLVLDGITAYEYWMSASNSVLSKPLDVSVGCLTDFDGLPCGELSRAIARTDAKPGELHLLVSSQHERRQSRNVCCHVWANKNPIPKGSIYQVGTGIYVESPELCLVRLAALLPREELLHCMSNMLGIFAFSTLDRMSLISRESITNVDKIRDCVRKLPGMQGTKALWSACSWVAERSASPRETSVNLCLALPTRVGGQALPPFEVNAVQTLDEEASRLTVKKHLVPDVYWRSKKLALEYNSSKHHDTEDELEADLEKITAMQKMDITVIPISTRQFNDFDAFDAIVKRVRKTLGVRTKVSVTAQERRWKFHTELLKFERSERKQPSLIETARWKYLIPRLYHERDY